MPGALQRGVFLSYRRDDAGPSARSLQLQLSQRIPDARIFMDLDSIEPGLDFAEVIEEAVNSSAVLVVLIGRQWATLTDEDGVRRLDNPDDYVRFEVKTALERGVRVIPVLIDGARALRRQDLPAELHKLARLNAYKLSWDRFQDDADRLLALIQRLLATVGEESLAEPEREPRIQKERARSAGEVEAEVAAAGNCRGWIDSPRDGDTVGTRFAVRGKARNMPEGHHLWIAHRIDPSGLFWPKHGAITLDEEGHFEVSVHEGGSSSRLYVSLLLVTAAVSADFQRWHDEARRTGHYPGLRLLSDSYVELASVSLRHDLSQARETSQADSQPTTAEPESPSATQPESAKDSHLVEHMKEAANPVTTVDPAYHLRTPGPGQGSLERPPQPPHQPCGQPAGRRQAELQEVVAEQLAADLERRYAQARVAEDGGDWTTSVRNYDEILKIDPAYRDVAARCDQCRQRSQVASLESELAAAVTAGDWPQVLATIEKVAELDPAVATKPSYTELVARARRELAVQTAEPLQRMGDGKRPVHALSWHPDNHRIAVAQGSYTRIWDIAGKEPKQQLAIRGGVWWHADHDAAFSLDGARLASGNDPTRIWDADSGRQLREFRLGAPAKVYVVAFSPDGTKLATGSNESSAWIWDAAKGKKLLEFRDGGFACAVAFSPDGTKLATGSNESSARIWDAAKGKKLLEFGHKGVVNSVAFSPDGTKLATGSNDMTARIWDAASGQKLLEFRHNADVNAVAFSPDGSKLATGGDDATARIWDAASGQKLLEFRHNAEVNAVAFSPDGTKLATGSNDMTARIWDVAGL